jgi:hypothetical protein
MSSFNANASEWKPNVNAAAWTPGGFSDNTTTTPAPTIVEEKKEPVPEVAKTETSEDDALLEELSELLASGEISKKDYDDAVAEMKGKWHIHM